MSKTFKALQRAAEERAAKQDGASVKETETRNPEAAETPRDGIAETELKPEREELEALRAEAAEALRRSEQLRDEAAYEARRAAEEVKLAVADRENALEESRRAAELARKAEESEKSAAEKEISAREAARLAERERRVQEEVRADTVQEKDRQEKARAAAEVERRALESIKEAVVQERSAQEAARAAIEKERAALEALREAMAKASVLNEPSESTSPARSGNAAVDPPNDSIPDLSKESAPGAKPELGASHEDDAIPSDVPADLPPLPDGNPDPALQKLLVAELVRSGDARPAKVGPFGRVAGGLDPERAAALLKRYTLLHCVGEGKDVTLWFWGNGKEAREYAASRGGLPLDEDALR